MLRTRCGAGGERGAIPMTKGKEYMYVPKIVRRLAKRTLHRIRRHRVELGATYTYAGYK